MRIGVLAIVLVAVMGMAATAFAGSQSNVAANDVTERPVLHSMPSVFPSWMAQAAASGVAGIGVQGWGPGPAGNYVGYLYDPYSEVLASRLLNDLRSDRTIPASDYVPSERLSQGGAAYPILTFRDGMSISVDSVALILSKTSNPAFRHARAGKMLFDLTSLQLQGSHDLRCSVYTPSVGSDTEEKIIHLIHG